MTAGSGPILLRAVATALLGTLCLLAAPSRAGVPDQALRERYAALAQRLSANQFGHPLVVDSQQRPDHVQADVYAVVDYPLERVRSGLSSAAHWCAVMRLHAGTQACSTLAQTG